MELELRSQSSDTTATATPTGWKHQQIARQRCHVLHGQMPRDDGARAGQQQVPAVPGKDHRTSVTAVEFKQWLKQFDGDGDGRISRRELREAIRRRGAWFAGVKAWRAVRRADTDRNGFVDDCEMDSLVEFGENELGFLISKEPAATATATPTGSSARPRNHCRW